MSPWKLHLFTTCEGGPAESHRVSQTLTYLRIMSAGFFFVVVVFFILFLLLFNEPSK